MATAGDVITYSYDITNCGNVTLSNVEVEENDVTFTGTGVLPIPSVISPSSFNPGDMRTSSSTYFITQEDIDAGIVTNQAIAIGDAPDGEATMDDSDSGNPLDEMGTDEDSTNEQIPQEPCLSLVKSSSIDQSADGISSVGDLITYTYEVTNCGNVTIDNLSIEEDPNLFTGTGVLPIPGPTSPSTIAPGEMASASATYAITAEDILAFEVTNQAMVEGDDPDGDPVNDVSDSGNPDDEMGTEEDPTITQIPLFNCIELVKSSVLVSGLDDFADVGDEILYTYEVTNCGNSILYDVEILELPNMFTGTGVLPVPDPLVPNVLGIGESLTTTSIYAITLEDIMAGQVVNQAIANGMNALGDTAEDISDSGNEYDEMGTDQDPTVTPSPDCPAFACNNLINVSLNGDCEVTITPDMITEGGSSK